MIAAYVRVSSRSQNLAMQRNAIEVCARGRREKIARWYCEKLSGAKVLRPALERLLDDARQGHINRLYVYRLDRLSRQGIAHMMRIVGELQHCGCIVQTVADGFSLEGPASEIILAVLAWAAKTERTAINERIAAARVRVEASGGHWGRPRRADDATVKRITKLDKEGRSIRAISIALKIPRGTVSNVLSKNGAYKPVVVKPAKKAPRKLAAGRVK